MLNFITTKLSLNQLIYMYHFYSQALAELSDPDVNLNLQVFLGVWQTTLALDPICDPRTTSCTSLWPLLHASSRPLIRTRYNFARLWDDQTPEKMMGIKLSGSEFNNQQELKTRLYTLRNIRFTFALIYIHLHDSAQTFRTTWPYEEIASIPAYSHKKNPAGEVTVSATSS